MRPVPADMERINRASEAAPMTVVVGAARGGPNERVVVASVSVSTRGQLTRLPLFMEGLLLAEFRSGPSDQAVAELVGGLGKASGKCRIRQGA